MRHTDRNYYFDFQKLKVKNLEAVTVCTTDKHDLSTYFQSRPAVMIRIYNARSPEIYGRYQIFIVPGTKDEVQQKMQEGEALPAYEPNGALFRELIISGEIYRFDAPDDPAIRDTSRMHCLVYNNEGEIFEILPE
ncbi:MAG: hypothetical protein ACT4OY_03650 [Alphaproteobacteria bacterium]